jgi:hypothetical protein
MASFPRRDAAPVFASMSCYRCHRLDIPCVLPIGSRTCAHCSHLKRRCSPRNDSAATRRFRSRLVNLRSALTAVLGVLDSVDFGPVGRVSPPSFDCCVDS